MFNFNSKKINTNNKYVKDAKEIYEAYKDFEKAYQLVKIEALKEETAEVFRKKIKNVFPFVNFVRDNMCKIYDENVIRTLDSVNKDNKNLNYLLNKVDEAFKKVDKEIDIATFLTGTTLVKPFYNNETNNFKFLFFPSFACDYTSYATDFSEAKEIRINYINNLVSNSEIWDLKKRNFYVDGSKYIEEDNNYNFIPFVKFTNNNTVLEFFDSPKTGLLKTQNQLTLKMLNVDRTFKYQSRSMLVFKSQLNDLTSLKIGPRAVNQINRDDSLEFITPNADLINLINFIKEEFSVLSKMYNIPDSIFSFNSSASGVSITASKSQINDYLKSRENMFLNFEKELFVKSIKVLAYHLNLEIPEIFDVNINYKKRKQILTAEDIAELTFLLTNNVINLAELIAERNNISIEEAKKVLEENKKINKLEEESKDEIIDTNLNKIENNDTENNDKTNNKNNDNIDN